VRTKRATFSKNLTLINDWGRAILNGYYKITQRVCLTFIPCLFALFLYKPHYRQIDANKKSPLM
jgi:hypothetical protein